MFRLSSLLEFDNIAIQCHDNPDPDAIASAYAVQQYLAQNGINVEIVYSGFAPIQKANLLLMETAFNIKMRYIAKNAEPPYFNNSENLLLITVDGQYGAGNVKRLEAEHIAVIDHHVREIDEPALCDIRPFLGSCATLVWLLLNEEGFNFSENLDVATALYYGLYTDTGALSEVVHPLDMDIRDTLKYDSGLLKKLKNSNLTMSDLMIAGKTLTNYHLDSETHSAIFEAEPCDPNILGFASDLALQVDNIDACVVFCLVSGGAKISVRSCVREIMANELASYLCEGVGSGGGHKDKAGGFISGDALEKQGVKAADFLKQRFQNYFSDYDLVYGSALDFDPTVLPRYRKKSIPIGYVKTTDVFPVGTELVIRTLEGDSFVSSDPDVFIIVGIQQEVYPIRRAKFEASYDALEGEYRPETSFWSEAHYAPMVKDHIQGTQVSLQPYIRPCVPTGEVFIYGRMLERRTKVFTSWNLDGYMFGDVGDCLAVRADDSRDCYVIEKVVFKHTYEPLED